MNNEINKDLLIKNYESMFIYLAKLGHINYSMIASIQEEQKYCNYENEKFIQELKDASIKNQAKAKANL